MGIDTPESRTRDKVEDLFGEAAKARLKELMKHGGKLITTEDRKGEDMKGKFGRILRRLQSRLQWRNEESN